MAPSIPSPDLAKNYIRYAGWIGAFYSLAPILVGFAWLFASVPLRRVYLVRFALSLIWGIAAAPYLHRYGISLWIIKHRSPRGPSTVLDGALIGAATGAAIALLPPLTSLLRSHHVDAAMTFVVVAWLIAAAVGAILGAGLAVVGSRQVSREWPAAADGAT